MTTKRPTNLQSHRGRRRPARAHELAVAVRRRRRRQPPACALPAAGAHRALEHCALSGRGGGSDDGRSAKQRRQRPLLLVRTVRRSETAATPSSSRRGRSLGSLCERSCRSSSDGMRVATDPAGRSPSLSGTSMARRPGCGRPVPRSFSAQLIAVGSPDAASARPRRVRGTRQEIELPQCPDDADRRHPLNLP